MESYQVTVVFTRELVQNAARHFLRRFIVRTSISDLVFICIGAILGLTGVISWELAIWWIIAGLAVIALVILVALNYVRSARSKFSAMTDPHVTYLMTENTFGTKSCLGSMEIPWKSITEIWKFDDMWLLSFGVYGYGYSTFPVSLMAFEVASFFEERVKANGGKVS